MALPSPRRLEGMFAPYALPSEAPVRVWGTDLGSSIPGLSPEHGFEDAGPPRLLCLAGGPGSLVVLRQPRDHRDETDGFVVPWSLVRRLERAPGFAHDVVSLEVAGHAPMRAQVSNHLLLRGNRAAAKSLCGLFHPTAPDASLDRQAPPSPAPPPESVTRPIPT